MKLYQKLSSIAVFGLLISSCVGIKNAQTETVKISGNCGMCETTIEGSTSDSKTATIEWDKNTKLAVLTFDRTKTTRDQLLKNVALAGYDNEAFRADDKAYANLPQCCQYDRIPLEKVGTTEVLAEPEVLPVVDEVIAEMSSDKNVMKNVFATYFSTKDAFVKSDGKRVSAQAKKLLIEINSIQVNDLSEEAHNVWMKTVKNLVLHTQKIQETTEIAKQREHLDALSDALFENISVIGYHQPVYYQFCPMANKGEGANWLSTNKTIENPFYGAQMLSCGSTVETVK